MKKTMSVLVAFRDTEGGHRTKLWEFIRDRVEREMPHAEICVSDDGPGTPFFNKPRAINLAADMATTDLYYILDSDSWVDPAVVEEVAQMVRSGDVAWGLPWTVKVKVSEAATNSILKLGPSWDGKLTDRMGKNPERFAPHQYAPPLLVPRAGFEKVNGMDERMGGYGMEDSAFGYALDMLWGKRVNIGFHCVHLYHPRLKRNGRNVWKGQKQSGVNHRMHQRYLRGKRKKLVMEQLVWQKEHGGPKIKEIGDD